MYVRLPDVSRAGLTASEAVAVVALATIELGTAQALVLIHGDVRGYRRYFEAGGAVRFGADGEPWVPVFAEPGTRQYRGLLKLARAVSDG
jgi:hypothetical protein